MKKIKIMFTCLILPWAAFANAEPATVKYWVTDLPNQPAVQVTVNHPTAESSTTLALRRSVSGVLSQVDDPRCDDRALNETAPGVWLVPAHCGVLQWKVSWAEAGSTTAAKQQSLVSGDFKVLSEASSLPRLQNANGREVLCLNLPYETVFPTANGRGELPLSNRTSPPLFVLMNAFPLPPLVSNNLRLNYFLDHREGMNSIPSEVDEMLGLTWMDSLLSQHAQLTFSVAWLGVPKELLSMGGATGSHVLLVNYANDGSIQFGQSMMLYIALHEAFHAMTEADGRQPTWVAESLASYVGMRATLLTASHHEQSLALMRHFIDAGSHFKDGLLRVNEKVNHGDQSEYAAFYTKGIAFWAAVDQAMQAQGDSLDHHLTEVLKLHYDKIGNPINLQTVCHLPPRVYANLRQHYLI